MNGRKFGPTCGFYIIINYEKVLKLVITRLALTYLQVYISRMDILLHRLFAVIEVRGRLLSFGAESFVFQFAIQKFKD
jgi:hypothetical protein